MPGTVNTLTEAGMRVFIDRTYGSDMVLTGAGPIRNAQYVYPEDIAGFSMLGNDGDLRWEFDEDGLQVDLPPKVPSDIAVAIRIELVN